MPSAIAFCALSPDALVVSARDFGNELLTRLPDRTVAAPGGRG
jgi:hypothetical protein